MYLKANPKANRKLLGALFKHAFREATHRIRTELFNGISRIDSVIEPILPHNLESGNRRL